MRMKHKTMVLEDGHRVGVTTVGTGTPLVFIHGFTANRKLYLGMLQELAYRGVAVTAIDLPGHGDTDALPEGHSYRDVLDVVVRTIDQLDLVHFALAGHSLGGRIATDAQKWFQHRIDALVLLDAAVGQPFDEHSARLEAGSLPAAFTTLVAALTDTVGDAITAGPMLPLFMAQYALSMPQRLRNLTGILRVGQAALHNVDTVKSLTSVYLSDIPTYVIHGENDKIVPFANARSAAEITQGHLMPVKGAYHSWMVARPAHAAELIAKAIVA